MKASICWHSSLTERKDAPLRELRQRMENQVSIWLSQDAWVGVKWKVRSGCFSSQAAGRFLWLEKLSQITWTSVPAGIVQSTESRKAVKSFLALVLKWPALT